MMGLRTVPYYIGYFISDYIFYIIPNLLVVVLCNSLSITLFTDYQIVKISCMVTFGAILIPLSYLIGFVFKDYDNAFRNSGLILYTFGFLTADAISCISHTNFYKEGANVKP